MAAALQHEGKGQLSFNLSHYRLTALYDLRGSQVAGCAAAGAAFALGMLFAVPAATALMTGYFVFTMLLVMLIDKSHFIIPDVLSLPAIPLGIATAVSAFPGAPGGILLDHAGAAAAAGGCLYAIRYVYAVTRKREGLGLGDVKLAAAAGAWVGIEWLPMVFLLATLSALTVVMMAALRARPQQIAMTAQVPFGCFLAPAIVVIWLLKLFE